MRLLCLALACLSCTIAPVGTSAADLSADFNRLVFKGSSELPRETDPAATRVGVLATGDFDCDGIDDIAIGDDLSNIAGVTGVDHGSVTIGFGSRLSALRSVGQLLNQDTSGVLGVAEEEDHFGIALAAADFDSDDCDDLAIGVSGEDDGGRSNSGGVNVLFGSSSGLNGVGDLFVPGTEAAPHGSTAGHFKGKALVALRNFTGASTQPFLAINAPGHSPGTQVSAGGVTVRRSLPTTLGSPATFVSRASFPFEIDRFLGSFGLNMAAADFNDDGFEDLVVYAANDGCLTPTAAASLCLDGKGYLWVVYGASSVGGFEFEKISQNSPGIAGAEETGDQFGAALATGDFNDDGRADLAVGAPGESIGDVEEAGSVTILYGAPGGLLGNTAESFAFDQDNVPGIASEAGDHFGQSLVSGDFNRDGFDDLAIGAPDEAVGSVAAAGQVVVAYGSASGIVSVGSRVLSLNSAGMAGVAEAGDRLGASLAAADFNDDQVTDLAIGVAEKQDAGNVIAGAISLVYSSGDTLTTIQSISPSPAIAGRPYTVNVTSRRQNTGGLALGRGTVNVSVSAGGGSCVATLSNLGAGSCEITTATPGIRTVNASFPGVIGYRASNATPSSLTVVTLPQNIFANSFE